METIDEVKYYFCLVTSTPIIIDFLRLLSHPKRARSLLSLSTSDHFSHYRNSMYSRIGRFLFKGIQLSANDDKMSRKCLIMCSLSIIIDVLALSSSSADTRQKAGISLAGHLFKVRCGVHRKRPRQKNRRSDLVMVHGIPL